MLPYPWQCPEDIKIDLVHSFVPADSAELGITDKILTKLNTQESVSKVIKPLKPKIYLLNSLRLKVLS